MAVTRARLGADSTGMAAAAGNIADVPSFMGVIERD